MVGVEPLHKDRRKLDKELVEKTILGDNTAFTRLVEAYYVIFYSLALRIVHDTGRAEDIVQEGLVTIYKELETLQDPERFGSWGYTLIRRKAIRALRNMKSESLVMEQYSEHEELRLKEETSRNETLKAGSSSKKTEVILEAIANLSPSNYREILMMYYVENIDIRDIANRLGLTLQTANIRLFRARKKLQKMLEIIV